MSNINQMVKRQMLNVKCHQSKSGGFTLIELLVVMAILAILFALVIVAINPIRQTQQANNTKRRSDINAILNAVNQYVTDNAGQLPSGITTTLRPIGTGGSCSIAICGSEFPSSSCYDLGGVVASTYIASMPHDPVTGTDADTRYAIKKSNSNNRVTVRACDAELSATIDLTQ